jgi:hypothetical protein
MQVSGGVWLAGGVTGRGAMELGGSVRAGSVDKQNNLLKIG